MEDRIINVKIKKFINKNITDFELIYNSKNRGGVRIYQYLKNIELDYE